MGDIVSLKLQRKARLRGQKEAEAAANRAKFGRTKDEKARAAANEELAARKLDAHKRDEE
jgi:Domain of unknown function (DUF4169)